MGGGRLLRSWTGLAGALLAAFAAVGVESAPLAQEKTPLFRGGNPSGTLKFSLQEQRYNYLDVDHENAPEAQTNTILPNLEGNLILPFTSSWSASIRSSYENDLNKTQRFYNAVFVDGGFKNFGARLDLAHNLSRNLQTNPPNPSDDFSVGFINPSIQNADATLSLDWSKRQNIRLNLEGFLAIETIQPEPQLDASFYENTMETDARFLVEKHLGSYHRLLLEEQFNHRWTEDLGGDFAHLESDSLSHFARVEYQRTFILGNQFTASAFHEIVYSHRYDSQRFTSFGANLRVEFSLGLDTQLNLNSKLERTMTSLAFLESPENENLFSLSNELEWSWELSRHWSIQPSATSLVDQYDDEQNADNNHLFLALGLPITYGSSTKNLELSLAWNRDRFYDFSYGELIDTVDEVLGVTNYADPLPSDHDEFGASLSATTTFLTCNLNLALEAKQRLYVWKDLDSAPRGGQYADEFFVAATLYAVIGLGPNITLDLNLLHNYRKSDDGYNTGADLEGGVAITYSF